MNNVIIPKDIQEMKKVKGGEGYYRPIFKNFNLFLGDSDISAEYYGKNGEYLNGTMMVFRRKEQLGTVRFSAHPYTGHVTIFKMELKELEEGKTMTFDEYKQKIKYLRSAVYRIVSCIAKANKVGDNSESSIIESSIEYSEAERKDAVNVAIKKAVAGENQFVTASYKPTVNTKPIKKTRKRAYTTPLYKDAPKDCVIISYERRGHWRMLRSGKKVWIKPCIVHKIKQA